MNISEEFKIYNIALLPKEPRTSIELVNLSLQFKNLSNYTLGEKSIPHVTVVQFEAVNSEISVIWEEILKIQEELSAQTLFLNLNKVNAFIEEDYVWLQLTLTDPLCHQLHCKVAQLLEKKGFQPRNQSYENYNPHVTLSHTADFSLIEELKKLSMSIKDEFYLVLGLSGACGQLVEILKENKNYNLNFNSL